MKEWVSKCEALVSSNVRDALQRILDVLTSNSGDDTFEECKAFDVRYLRYLLRRHGVVLSVVTQRSCCRVGWLQERTRVYFNQWSSSLLCTRALTLYRWSRTSGIAEADEMKNKVNFTLWLRNPPCSCHQEFWCTVHKTRGQWHAQAFDRPNVVLW
jgi:hypothetical protein